MTGRTGWAALLLVTGGCGITDAPPPDPDKYINIGIVSGAEQVGLPGSVLADPIEVKLRSTVNGDPIRAREVRFSARSESGIVLTPATTFTDNNGIARTQARLGSAVGRHPIEITFADNPGVPTTVMVEAALAPVITQLEPAQVTADGTIVITGDNFSPTPTSNEVQIDGSRAAIISATTTRLEARVPACLPTRAAQLVVRRGSLVSAATTLNVAAASGQAMNLARGQAVAVNDRNNVACVRIAAQAAGAEYLVVMQNTTNSGNTQVPLRLVGLRDGAATSTQQSTFALQPANAAESFAATMRQREVEIVKRMAPKDTRTARVDAFSASSVPEVGERRPFRVFVPRQPAATITAVARAVGRYLAIYEDVEAEGTMSQADLERVLATLDDPVFATDVAVYGNASDLDRNQRVILLLTPAVNRLTRADETSFISGYFDPCDLVDVNECSDTNRAEILYSFVPDPDGRWGLKHSAERVTRLLPPLAAHELAHLIHFNQRILVSGIRTPEELWLSEALAHAAEDTVAGVLRNRGLTAEADVFARENLIRASYFLAAPEKTSLIASTGEATIEERGASWLFLKYLQNRVGGTLLRRIETSPETGARTITNVTGVPWANLMRDWSVALFASGSPELAGVTVAPEYTFGAYEMRTLVAGVTPQGYGLKLGSLAVGDFSVDWTMTPSATSFARLSVAAGAGVNLIVGGERGGTFATAAQPQITIFRIR